MPYHDATSTVPSWARRDSAPGRTAGLPDASMTRATPPAQPAVAMASPTSSGATAVADNVVATSRRQACGSTAITRAPARRSSGDGQQADDPEAEDDDRLAEHGPGVERDLQRRLGHRQQGRRALVPARERHDAGGIDDEPVLVRVEGEHEVAGGELGLALLDAADAAVAVSERVAKGAAEGADRLVHRHLGIELTAEGQHLGPSADPRERRAHQQLTVAHGGELRVTDLHASAARRTTDRAQPRARRQFAHEPRSG